MKILDTKFVRGFVKMADDGFQQGWHERNGGNLSYRLHTGEWRPLNPALTIMESGIPSGHRCPISEESIFL